MRPIFFLLFVGTCIPKRLFCAIHRFVISICDATPHFNDGAKGSTENGTAFKVITRDKKLYQMLQSLRRKKEKQVKSSYQEHSDKVSHYTDFTLLVRISLV